MQKFIVGGYVRDFILKRNPSDKDWVVVGSTVEEMLSKGFKQVGSRFPVFLHPETNEEYALARKEIKSGNSHQDFQFVFTPDITLEEDLQRRDFTINALVMDENHNLIENEFTKRALLDIENKTLDLVDANHFSEDPLRIIRAIRFASVLGFKFSTNLLTTLISMVGHNELKNVTTERIYTEFKKVMKEHKVGPFFELMHKMKCLQRFNPDLDLMFTNCPENTKYHPEGQTGGHVANALRWIDQNIGKYNLTPDEEESIYWSTMFHDIGKPFTNPEEFPRHHNHDEVGFNILTSDYINQMKIPQKFLKPMQTVAGYHMKFWPYLDGKMKKAKRFRLIMDIMKNVEGNSLLFLLPVMADNFCNNYEKDQEVSTVNDLKLVMETIYQNSKTVKMIPEVVEKILPVNRSEWVFQQQYHLCKNYLVDYPEAAQLIRSNDFS